MQPRTQAFELIAWKRKEACKTEAAVLLLVCNGADLASEEPQKAIAMDIAAQEAALKAIDLFQEKQRAASRKRLMWQYYADVLHHLSQRLCVRVKISTQFCDESQMNASDEESDAEVVDLTQESDEEDGPTNSH